MDRGVSEFLKINIIPLIHLETVNIQLDMRIYNLPYCLIKSNHVINNFFFFFVTTQNSCKKAIGLFTRKEFLFINLMLTEKQRTERL